MLEGTDILKQKLAEVIKEYRLEQNRSISLLSGEVNLSKSIWSDLEKGIKDPQLSTLWKVAESLNVPLSQIIKVMEENLKNKLSFIENQ